MKYFKYDSSTSLEDIDNQYRALLKKYNYKDSNNEKILAEIDNEYSAVVAQAKYDSGYRTLGQSIVESFQDGARKKQDKRDVIEQIRKSKYTKSDLELILKDFQNYIREEVKYTLKGSSYIFLKYLIEYGDDVRVYNFLVIRPKKYGYYNFLTDDADVIKQKIELSDQREQTIEHLRLRLSSCVLYLSKNDKDKANERLSTIEGKLTDFYIKQFLKSEKEYVDTIDEHKALKKARNKVREVKSFYKLVKTVYILLWVIAVVVILMSQLRGIDLDALLALGLIFGYVELSAFIIYKFLLRAMPVEADRRSVKNHRWYTDEEIKNGIRGQKGILAFIRVLIKQV
ncbi:hypothetical protein [Pseudobutyrivibrio xylanivorans]|uniref:J domain-containing protein n=1 Tax=Pseudobutyrivibrio xylanivorans TaxID=185007 RepID=A0A5P6VMZ2_PSEXY|nr:hypothetical protein [Pseudobutyrivibrio xylanivorans]QFJ54036.1 hypothetical protein FXF36_03695 [Pseudobutyrivibrio xylanivorans]